MRRNGHRRAVVLYVFRTLVGKDIPLNRGLPEAAAHHPARRLDAEPARYPAAVIAGNTEVSQAACNALYGALGVMAGKPGHDEQFRLGQ